MDKALCLFVLFFKVFISMVNAADVDNPSSEPSIRSSNWQSCVVGGSAGAVEGILTFSFYAQKLRAQRGEIFTPDLTYKGFAIKALSASGSFAVKLTARDCILRYGFKTDRPDFTQNFIASFVGGASASCIVSPAELVIAQQQVKTSAFLPTVKEIYKYGVRLFLRGLPSVGVKDGITTTCVLCLTPYLYGVLKNHSDSKYALIPMSLSIGLLSAGLSHPFDTVKTIQQSSLLTTEPKFIQTAIDLYKKGGIRGFYKGFAWRTVRHGVGIPILYFATEGFSRLYVESRQN